MLQDREKLTGDAEKFSSALNLKLKGSKSNPTQGKKTKESLFALADSYRFYKVKKVICKTAIDMVIKHQRIATKANIPKELWDTEKCNNIIKVVADAKPRQTLKQLVKYYEEAIKTLSVKLQKQQPLVAIKPKSLFYRHPKKFASAGVLLLVVAAVLAVVSGNIIASNVDDSLIKRFTVLDLAMIFGSVISTTFVVLAIYNICMHRYEKHSVTNAFLSSEEQQEELKDSAGVDLPSVVLEGKVEIGMVCLKNSAK